MEIAAKLEQKRGLLSFNSFHTEYLRCIQESSSVDPKAAKPMIGLGGSNTAARFICVRNSDQVYPSAFCPELQTLKSLQASVTDKLQ